MKNLGPKSSAWLQEIGVETVEDIRERGIVNVYVELKLGGRDASKNMLWALWGAVNDRHWQEIPPAEKARLIKEVEAVLGSA